MSSDKTAAILTKEGWVNSVIKCTVCRKSVTLYAEKKSLKIYSERLWVTYLIKYVTPVNDASLILPGTDSWNVLDICVTTLYIETERQSCWRLCSQWLHLRWSPWPPQVQPLTTKSSTWLPLRFIARKNKNKTKQNKQKRPLGRSFDLSCLIYRDLNKMSGILQTFLNAYSCMKGVMFLIKFHWTLCRQATSHCVGQWWLCLRLPNGITRSQ